MEWCASRRFKAIQYGLHRKRIERVCEFLRNEINFQSQKNKNPLHSEQMYWEQKKEAIWRSWMKLLFDNEYPFQEFALHNASFESSAKQFCFPALPGFPIE